MESEQTSAEPNPVPAAASAVPVRGTAVKAAGAEVDLSAEIAAAIERSPGDRVRVTRVCGCNYRCNWWAVGGGANAGQTMPGLVTTTYRVRKSRFLSVTKVGGGLLIK